MILFVELEEGTAFLTLALSSAESVVTAPIVLMGVYATRNEDVQGESRGVECIVVPANEKAGAMTLGDVAP